MTEPGPPQDPFAPPPPGAVPTPSPPPPPPPPPVWGPPPPGGPPPPSWAHPQLQQPWAQNPWQQQAPQSPWQQPGWQPQSWSQPPTRTNGLAIAALITGVLALVPVAVGLGIGALVQIGRRGERGRGLAIGGLAAAGAWTLIAAVLLALGLTGNLDYRQGDLDDVASTTVGTCLLKHPSRVTDCNSPHHYEIYDSYTFEEGPWPGDFDVDDTADSFCDDSFGDRFGNYYTSDYDYGYFSPTEEQWRAGRRTVVCVVLDTFGGKFDHKAS